MSRIDEASRLDHHLDALLFGDPAPRPPLDPRLATTLADLRELNAAPPPSPAFVASLEQRLLDSASHRSSALAVVETAKTAGRARERLGPALPIPRRPRLARSHAWFATAALVVLTLAASFGILWYGAFPRTHEAAPLSAVPSDPVGDACQVQPRRIVPAPPRTGTSTNLLPASSRGELGVLDASGVAELREGARLANSDVVGRIAVLLETLVACQNHPDAEPSRVFALFTDTFLYFALDMAAMSPPHDLSGETLRERLARLPQPDLGSGEPAIEIAWMLPEGEVGAIVRPRAGSAYYVLGAWADGQWLIDELAFYPFPAGFVPPIGTPPGAEAPLELAAVTMFDILYIPGTLAIPADTAVTLALTNAGVVNHAFVIDALGIDVRLQPGETKTITIEAAPGVYDYFCDVPGHRDAGMIGALTALASDGPRSATPTP